MPTIDLFNNAADKAELYRSIDKGTFRVASKQYFKYFVKESAQSLIVLGTISLAVIGAVAIAASALENSNTESE